MVVTTKPVWKAINELATRGISLKYITDIGGDNISFCKMMVENGVQLRHLPGITSNFGIIDRMEYMATVVMEEKKPLWHATVSNAKTFVEGQQSVFDALWSKASLAEQRIRDIEEGLKPAFIETISNPSEIQNLAFDLVKSAKEEIMIIFSTANAFERQKHAGQLRLLDETDPIVKVRILVPAALEWNDSITNKLDENQRIEIRYFVNSSLQTRLTTLIGDRKYSQVVELKDDRKDNSYEAIGLATYSNSESTVWTHASIFETLWIKSELENEERINQKAGS
jgi:two-component system sensor histidine kinase VicK